MCYSGGLKKLHWIHGLAVIANLEMYVGPCGKTCHTNEGNGVSFCDQVTLNNQVFGVMGIIRGISVTVV